MKKKLLSLLLAGVLAFGSVGCVSAEELEECEATINIDVIKHYLAPNKRDNSHPPLALTITIPEEYMNDALVGFYTNGQLTKLSKFNTVSENFELELTKEDGDELLQTPDEIKIFVWDKGKLIPLTKSKNLLETDETGCNTTIQSANYRMIEYLLKYYVDTGDNFTTVTEFLDNNYLTENDVVILSLLDIMEKCAVEAYSYKDTHLLTSEFGRRLFYEDLSQVYELLQNADNKAQKDKLINIWLNLNNDGAGDIKNYLERLFNFLRIDIDKFINGEGM